MWSEGGEQQTQQAIHAEVGEAGGAEGAEGGETGACGGEENTAQYGLGDTFDQVRAGSRLIMNYDPAANAFVGTVENTTQHPTEQRADRDPPLQRSRIGPTTPIDLAPGEVSNVRLDATTQPFDTWVAHAEVGTQGPDQRTGGSEGTGEGSEDAGEAHGPEGGQGM